MDDMDRALRAACAAHTATIVQQHLLKLRYSPAGEPRRGGETIVRAARLNRQTQGGGPGVETTEPVVRP